GTNRQSIGAAQDLKPDHQLADRQAQTLRDVAGCRLFAIGDQSAADLTPGASDDFGKSRSPPDRIGDSAGLDEGSPATFRTPEASQGKLRKLTACGVTVDVEALGALHLAGQPLADRVDAGDDLLFDIIRDPAP